MAQLLGNTALGSIVYCRENGVNVAFYVAKHNYLSSYNGTGRTLLVRKDCYDKLAWHSSAVNAYASSSIDSWLETSYKALLDADVQTAVGTTRIPYTPGNGTTTVSSMYRSVFLLSGTEIGISSSTYMNTEGEALDSSVVSLLKVAYLNGSACGQWTRSPHTNYTYYVWYLNASGTSYYATAASTDPGCRPAFTLPATATVEDSGEIRVNELPVISSTTATGSHLGTKNAPFSWNYTVTDAEGDSVTALEYLDGSFQRTHKPTLGASNTFQCVNNAAQFQKILNGTHTLSVTAADSSGTQCQPYTVSFTKSVTSASITLASPLRVAGDIEAAILSVSGSIPEDAVFKAEVTNNAEDASPVWQDCTAEIKAGENIVFTNKTAANGAAFNFRISVSRGTSGTGGYILSISGAFQ